MVDVLNEFIISSSITNRKVEELKHAINHVDDAKSKIFEKQSLYVIEVIAPKN